MNRLRERKYCLQRNQQSLLHRLAHWLHQHRNRVSLNLHFSEISIRLTCIFNIVLFYQVSKWMKSTFWSQHQRKSLRDVCYRSMRVDTKLHYRLAQRSAANRFSRKKPRVSEKQTQHHFHAEVFSIELNRICFVDRYSSEIR